MTESPVQIVASIAARTTDALYAGRTASRAADIVELRLDGVGDLDLDRALAGEVRPVIASCRSVVDGGRSTASDRERFAVLCAAFEAGAHWIDIEWHSTCRDEALRHFGDRVVVSFHDHEGVPSGLAAIAGAMAESVAGVIKLAVTPATLRDALGLADLRAALPADRRIAIVGMGARGVVTRVLPRRFGSCWTYGGEESGRGQLPVDDLADVFRVREQTDQTTCYALFGRPVKHSVGPWMHNAGLRAAGLDAVYVPLDAADWEDARYAADRLPLAGASVTAPYKREAAAFAARRDALTEHSGAANTLHRVDGRWAASNFDLAGFLKPLQHVALEGRRALVLGAGGAARAVVVGLHGRGMHVTIAARRPEAADALARELDATTAPWPEHVDADLLVNTTPVGTWPDVDATPMPGADFGGALVYDLVYTPEDTRLLRDAAAQGCAVIGGLEMLVAQAHEQFRQWTGHDAHAGEFLEAARTLLERRRTAQAAHA